MKQIALSEIKDNLPRFLREAASEQTIKHPMNVIMILSLCTKSLLRRSQPHATWRLLARYWFLFCLPIVFAVEVNSAPPPGYRLVYSQSFDRPDALNDFVLTDPKAWKVTTENGQSALELVTQSNYQPAVRSPFNIALLADKIFGDFILEADLIQTGKEYGHRDMVLFFGFQNPTNFYYAHIATAADDHAHNIFLVKNAPRTKIAQETTKGVNWGLGVWHKVRLERKLADGSIKVFFDDLTKPIMVAEDKTFGAGYIGFGSFDDTGKVDNIKIWAPAVKTKKAEFFGRP